MNQSLGRILKTAKPVATKVPELTLYFWVAKILTTGMGEVFSDFLVKHMNPIIAVLLGGVAFILALILQFAVRQYIAWIYWLMVVMVSVFGTMAADVVHIVLHVPYLISTFFFMIVLASILILWYRTEKTLSIHSIYTTRRELWYWLTVLATFALGTAAGDMTAATLGFGYLTSGILFTIVLLVPIIGFRLRVFNSVFAFWFAYILTRPVGASYSDWLSKPKNLGGLSYGEGPVSLVLTLIIVVIIAYFQITKCDIRPSNRRGRASEHHLE